MSKADRLVLKMRELAARDKQPLPSRGRPDTKIPIPRRSR